jgi:ribosome-associated protein
MDNPTLIIISKTLSIPFSEIDIVAICSSGPGGQNVNKVSTGIHLRFDILASSISEYFKQRLLNLHDSRISASGVINIKAQQFRTQGKNKEDAIHRFIELIKKSTHIPKKRIASKPSKASKVKRINNKKEKSLTKNFRKKIKLD